VSKDPIEGLLRVNPGGRLSPAEVVGCDPFIAGMWHTLLRQSVVLTGERRMGKTSVLGKMLAEAPTGRVAIKRSLQGIKSPEEFVRALIADTERTLPGVLRRSLGSRLRKAGVKKIGVSAVSVEFDPPSEQSWKDVAADAIAVLDHEPDVAVVLLWDELPHMVANVRDNHGPLVARDLLDLLRAIRESHERVRMVFSGSIGLHHVVHGLRAAGGMWVPTHDMLVVDLPPLLPADATYLARALLCNEDVMCDDPVRVAAAIAEEVDCVPYDVHHTVNELMTRQRTRRCGDVDVGLVREVVDAAVADPLDPWQLHHYVDRIESYYGDDADFVKALLDLVAAAPTPPTLATIETQVGAYIAPPPAERIRDLLMLLCKDHYLVGGPAYGFRLELVRRVWRARRPVP
jgi:AAA domain